MNVSVLDISHVGQPKVEGIRFSVNNNADTKVRTIKDEIIIAEGLTDPPKPVVKGKRHKI